MFSKQPKFAPKNRVPIISITGTKGKTTVTGVIADILQHYGRYVLKVDTKGHYVNGELKGTLDESRALYGLVPTVAPGRFLYELKDHEKKGVAVLETALGSSSLSGLGYKCHNIGIFLNVFEDHLGSSSRLKTRQDIAHAKRFVFERLDIGGYAVFNADDDLVVDAIKSTPEGIGVQLVPFGLKFDSVKRHLAEGLSAVMVDDGWVVMASGQRRQKIVKVSDVAMTFEGHFTPSVYNLMAVVGGLYGFFGGKLPTDLGKVLKSYRLNSQDGRLTLFKSKDRNVKILADYAHEKYSLREVGKLARQLAGAGGRSIGVVRLAYDRTDELIRETGQYIANDFDSFVVYDKIDGYWRKPRKQLRSRIFKGEKVGRVSDILHEAIKAKNSNCERILREDKAVARAAELAGDGDVVVVIVNDDIRRSLDFIKQSFNAELA
jgi:cyanophycin synthetase